MGMGYGANYADAISEAGIKKIVGNELFNKFIEVVEADEDMGMDEVANALQYEDSDEMTNKEITEAYSELVKVFNEKTGLELSIGYHDEEQGDRYDDMQGIYWSVGGMYDLTPEGKKLQEVLGEKNQVERQFFVTFG
jgi:hypothetical protein